MNGGAPGPGTLAFGAGAACVLPLPSGDFAALPVACELEGIALQRRHEFHVTLVDTALAGRLHEHSGSQSLQSLRSRLRGLAAALDWRYARSGEYWLLSDDSDARMRRSLIERIAQPAQQCFRAALADWLGVALPAPFPHVTVYTCGEAAGIGVFDAAAFERLRVRAWAPGELFDRS